MVARYDKQRILFVDDDARLLGGIQRRLRRRFALDTAVGPEEGLRMVRERPPYAVVVADMNMPGMDGSTFLERVRELSPDSVRMMLTGNADLATAVKAVNQGSVFRFISKPCPPDELESFLAAGLAQRVLVESERRAAAAEEASRAKSNFLATVSHELVTPLSGIRSAAEILAGFDGISPKEQKEFLGAIVASSNKLETLLGRILKMAELDAGRVRSAPERVGAPALVEIVAAAVGPDRSIHVGEGLGDLTCLVDVGMFGEIVAALLDNARVHGATPDPTVSVECHDEGVLLTVADHGPGVDADLVDRLFDPFFQVDETLVDKPQGLGLGLAVSKALVREHGGRLAYHPGEHGGAVFECWLPAAQARPVEVRP